MSVGSLFFTCFSLVVGVFVQQRALVSLISSTLSSDISHIRDPRYRVILVPVLAGHDALGLRSAISHSGSPSERLPMPLLKPAEVDMMVAAAWAASPHASHCDWRCVAGLRRVWR